MYCLSNPLNVLVQMNFIPAEGMVEAEFILSEDAHLAAIENWRDQLARIVNYCMLQGDAELSAARLYQNMAQILSVPGEDWLPAEDDPMAAFWPSAYYAIMNNRVSGNDAAKLYAYLLMQLGLESMYVQAAFADEEDAERTGTADAHMWIVFWQGQFFTHADLEMDLFHETMPEADRDALGHFGMDDERCSANISAENGFEMVVPESMRKEPTAETPEKLNEVFRVPACAAALSTYSAAEETVIEEIVEEVDM